MARQQMETHRMDGAVVLVSGGSSGVGLASAKGLAHLGARTVLISRRADRGEAAVRAVQLAAPGADVTTVTADLTSPAAIYALMDHIGARFGRLDVLVNAAGSVGEQGELSGGIPRSFATNALTHCFLTRAAMQLLQQAPTGKVLNVGAAPALVRRLRTPELDGVRPDASATTLITQSLAWKLALAASINADSSTVTATVFHPGLIRSELLDQRALPLRLFGTLSNRFASDLCPIVDHLASTPATSSTAVMVDQHGRRVPLPAFVTAAAGDRVRAAASRLASAIEEPGSGSNA